MPASSTLTLSSHSHPPFPLQVPSGFDNDGMLRQKARLLKRIPSAPIPTYLWAAGFSFTNSNVPLPPSSSSPHIVVTIGCHGARSL
jgi:hypothetical protein